MAQNCPSPLPRKAQWGRLSVRRGRFGWRVPGCLRFPIIGNRVASGRQRKANCAAGGLLLAIVSIVALIVKWVSH